MKLKNKWIIVIAFCISTIISLPITFAQDKIDDLKRIDLNQYSFIDSAGNASNLGKFKGKYILVDIWASWCRPCINKFPDFDSLKLAYKDKNIAFLQISCDQEERRWRSGMGYTHRSGDQWFLTGDRKFMTDLQVATIPRYLLVDKNGKIIDANLIWKDNVQIGAVLSKLKGI